jgi:hypothetical protein
LSKRSAPKEKASPRKRVAVEGAETPDRVLVIRFDELWEILAAPPDTAEAEEERLLSGIDLLGGLLDGGEDFGRATPGEPEDFAARALSLTDDAFSAAYEILDDTDYERAYGPPPADAKAFLRRAATDLLDNALFGAVAKALAEAQEAEDPQMGGELL